MDADGGVHRAAWRRQQVVWEKEQGGPLSSLELGELLYLCTLQQQQQQQQQQQSSHTTLSSSRMSKKKQPKETHENDNDDDYDNNNNNNNDDDNVGFASVEVESLLVLLDALERHVRSAERVQLLTAAVQHVARGMTTQDHDNSDEDHHRGVHAHSRFSVDSVRTCFSGQGCMALME